MPQLSLSDLHQGMDVVGADDQSIGQLVEVYHVGQDEHADTGRVAEEVDQAPSAEPRESRAYLRVRPSRGGPDLFVPLEALQRIDGRTVELRATRDEALSRGWERQPRLVQLAEARLRRSSA